MQSDTVGKTQEETTPREESEALPQGSGAGIPERETPHNMTATFERHHDGAAIPKGDDSARATFIETHAPQVGRVVDCLLKRSGTDKLRGLERDDLVQEGTIGLIHAVDTFDANHGVAFDQYARMCIANHVRQAARNYAGVELAPLDEETLPGFSMTDSADAKLLIEQLLPKLPDTQRDVIRLHYLEGYTPTEIATQLGISRQAVSQRIENGLIGLRRLAEQ